MELSKAIIDRRSIRKYLDKKVDKKLVEEILNAGRLAPSAKNKQPWYFVVLTGSLKSTIADTMYEYAKNAMEKELDKKTGIPITAHFTSKVVRSAPVLIVVLREKDDNWIEGDNQSIGACMENMCLKATELGLGSLWIRDTVYVRDKIASLINHPDKEVNCCLALGYIDVYPEARPRHELKEIVEWNDK